MKVSVFDKTDEQWKSTFVDTLEQTSDPNEIFNHDLMENGKMDFQNLLIIFEDRYKNLEYGADVHNMDSDHSKKINDIVCIVHFVFELMEQIWNTRDLCWSLIFHIKKFGYVHAIRVLLNVLKPSFWMLYFLHPIRTNS